MLDTKYLKEYHCPTCNKLLCKGFMNSVKSILEVKCRSCGNICRFRGKDAEIVSHRALLIKNGIIEDTDPK